MSCIEEKHGNLEGKKTYIFEGNSVCLVFSALFLELCICSLSLMTSVFAAYNYAAQALQLDQESAEVHKWYGILVGAKGEFLGVKERIHNGTLFKVHIDKALEIKPKDSTLHHLLGRFCYEVQPTRFLLQVKIGCFRDGVLQDEYSYAKVSLFTCESLVCKINKYIYIPIFHDYISWITNFTSWHANFVAHCWQVAQLSWLERRVAAALFGEVPSSTYEEALEHFMAAEKLRPTGWKENRLFIAKCYILMSEFSLASAWLEQAASASSVTPDVGCAR